MGNRSFANQLTWMIIGIVSVVILVLLIVLGLALQSAIRNDSIPSEPAWIIVNLLIVGIIGLVVLYFPCRRMIRHMTRPVTELSVSAMNMAKGNFKAKLPEIKSEDEMRRLHDSFLYMQNSITDYIHQLKSTKSANELVAKGKSAHEAYTRGVVNAILTSRYNHIKVTVDGKRINRGYMILCTIANGRRVGGEFNCAPNAKVDDGLIDVCLFRPMSLLRFLMLIPLYRKGEHGAGAESSIVRHTR